MEILLELELDVFARLLQVPISTSRVSTTGVQYEKREKEKRKTIIYSPSGVHPYICRSLEQRM
jgi:hypothetical protein